MQDALAHSRSINALPWLRGLPPGLQALLAAGIAFDHAWLPWR